MPAAKVNDDRLYRALDALLPHKDALQKHLAESLGELFELDYDLLLYDVTSTYFEGQTNGNPQAQRGYSRNHRGDCKRVCIGLVVSRRGMPLGYEVFAGNRSDVTTLQEVIVTMEGRYGKARRIWVVDRGMVSQDNIEFLQAGGRRYIILVCFLAYVLWKTLGQLCRQAGLGDDPRKVLAELAMIRVIDVVVPTRSGVVLHKRCITRPTDHQAILLQRLGLHLPSRIKLLDAPPTPGPQNPM